MEPVTYTGARKNLAKPMEKVYDHVPVVITRINRLIMIALLFIVTFGGALTMDANNEAGFPQTAGIYKQTLTLKNSALLRYTLSIPLGYSGQQPVPLVLALHYGGTVTPWYGGGYLQILVEPALRNLGALLVAPDCPGEGWDNPGSETAVLELLNHIKTHYPVDERRIVITGFSLGGMGTWYLAARLPQLFCAAIPMSGITDRETLQKIKNTPIYVIHSRQDEIFPLPKVERMVRILKANGADVRLEVLKGISHYHTGQFVESLRNTIPWIKKIWEKTG
jgi:predicted peptidase